MILGGSGQKVLPTTVGNPQVLRIPVSSSSSSSLSGNVSVGQLQKIQIGNKIQYVRVIPSGAQKSAAQNTTIRQTQPILPSTTKGGGPVSLKAVSAAGNQQVVKIALPNNYQPQSGVRTFLSRCSSQALL